MDIFTNCKPADWKTGFEPKLSVESAMPYEEYAEPIEMSGNDKRQYRLIRLPSSLVALCVQDSESEVASASLSVGVGSNANSAQLQGLAHFLEHMLFLGTEKYPKEGGYDEYISSNSGKTNAYTSFEETNYHFSVVNGAFEGALDQFAQFFIAPLFNADCVDRELKAVDSEYKNMLQNDQRRLAQLCTSTTNPAHPYSQFSSGNIQTLRDAANALGLNLRDEMIKFYEKYYSADIMRLVVVGNHSLDVLTEWTVSKFSAVVSKGNTTPSTDCRLLSSAEIGKVIRYKTVGERYNLELHFSVPAIKSAYRHKPFGYINSLIGHKGPGSIFSVLQRNGWATSLSANNIGASSDGFTIYRIGVTATPKGLEEYQAIVGLVFAYVKMLKEQGPQEWFFQELSLIVKARFDYKAREGVESYACNMSSGAHNEYVLPTHILSHGELLHNYDAELISDCLGFINPQNYRLFIGAQEHKSVDCHLKEKHYGILHHIADLPACLTLDECVGSASGESIHLPARNVFLPDNFTVAKLATAADKPTSEPTLLRKNGKYEVWFKQDDQFFTPHGCIGLVISSETTNSSPKNLLLSQLFIRLATSKLNEQLHSALLANAGWAVNLSKGSISVDVSGYNSKLPLLLSIVVSKLKAFRVDAEQFQIQQEKYGQEICNSRLQGPRSRLYSRLGNICTLPAYDLDMLEEALKTVSLNALQAHIDMLFSRAYVKIVVCGNYTELEALNISSQVSDLLHHDTLPSHMINSQRAVAFEPGYYAENVPIVDVKCVNSSVCCAIHCNNESNLQESVTLQVLKNLVHNAFFSQLRTTEQLGYSVHAVLQSLAGGKNIFIFMLEGESNPAYMTKRVNEFIRQYRQKLLDMTMREFETAVQSLIRLKQDKLKSVSAEFSRFRGHIVSNKYDFDALNDEVAHLEQLRKGDLLAVWDTYVNADTAPQYTRIDLQMWSAKIWQPSADEFEAYPSAVLALYSWLRSSGQTALSIADLYEFVKASAASDNNGAENASSIEPVLAKLSELYIDKDPTLEHKDVWSSSSKISTALQMAISGANDHAKFASLCKTNLASIGMRRSPDGVWLINDYKQFKQTQALHGLPIPARQLVPVAADSIPDSGAE